MSNASAKPSATTGPEHSPALDERSRALGSAEARESPRPKDPQSPTGGTPDSPRQVRCTKCQSTFRSPQGLAGHELLAHSATSRKLLEARQTSAQARERTLTAKEAALANQESSLRQRESSVAQRERELEETGAAALGYEECAYCDAWFEDEDLRAKHQEEIHPLEKRVGDKLGISPARVTEVWREACRKHDRHPKQTPEEIIRRFWSDQEQEILKAVRREHGVFEFNKGGR
jgi:hypothetical protein